MPGFTADTCVCCCSAMGAAAPAAGGASAGSAPDPRTLAQMLAAAAQQPQVSLGSHPLYWGMLRSTDADLFCLFPATVLGCSS